jgi:MtN3 and saliva related transmembrane protein
VDFAGRWRVCLIPGLLVLLHDQTEKNGMDFIEALGLVAGICTSSSLVPQLITTIKKKKASEVSTVMFIVLLTGNALWVYYGFDKKDIPIISTNLFTIGLNIAMLTLKYKYKNNE